MRRSEQVPDFLVKIMILAKESENLDDSNIDMLTSAFMISGKESSDY